MVEYKTEFLSYDDNDVISSVGGNLGLFLGWSCMTIFEALTFIICVMKVKNRKNDH